jgi:hypothetical protein
VLHVEPHATREKRCHRQSVHGMLSQCVGETKAMLQRVGNILGGGKFAIYDDPIPESVFAGFQ